MHCPGAASLFQLATGQVITQPTEDLHVVFFGDGLVSGSILMMHQPSTVEKTVNIALTAHRTCRTFFGLGDVDLLHCDD